MSAPPAIYTAGTLWARLIEQQRSEAQKADVRPDSYVYFVGSRASGKSTLLNRFLHPDKTDALKPTEGVEYTFVRKQAAGSLERKDLAHIYELSGPPELAAQVVQGDSTFLGPLQVSTATVVIAADLSRPGEVMPTVLGWLAQVQQRLAATYDSLEKRGSRLPEQLRLRARRYFGGSHEDRDAVQHTGIAVVIAATKEDAFRDKDAEVRKVLARSLRYVAHLHGASLLYLGGLGGGPASGGRDAAGERAQLANFRALLSHLAFVGLDKRVALRSEPQMDHLQPLMVPMGADRFAAIGSVRGAGEGGAAGADGVAEWRAICARTFPPPASEAPRQAEAHREQFAEAEVDAEFARCTAELETARKERTAAQAAALEAKRQALIARQQGAQQRRRTGSSKQLQVPSKTAVALQM